ncbi:hypothetical protein [Dickeya fangzhongdai]|uniref:hypothetical protein n=1 Tax=Dickeya fangzhongdai TaxID=1778540 RepID=UPI0026DF488E|nr:hypothetical protein [Dickeya fangzhongdai]WKV50597.1 hypothetical protein PL145_22680 [Dickeya fangzhongdai]
MKKTRYTEEQIAFAQKQTEARSLAWGDTVDYLDVFDNQTRRYSYLGGVSPEASS